MSPRMSASSLEDCTFRVAVDMMFSPLFRLSKKHFQIPAQMIQAGGRNLRAVLGLREDERALNDGLCVKREALGAPIRIDAVLAQRAGNVRLEHPGVIAYVLLAGLT